MGGNREGGKGKGGEDAISSVQFLVQVSSRIEYIDKHCRNVLRYDFEERECP